MNLIQAQAAYQVAELRYNADPNETTEQALASAKKYLEELDAPKEKSKDAEAKAESKAKAKAESEAKADTEEKADAVKKK